MPRPHIRLAREMSLLQVTMIGVGAMIGAGIFVLTGIAAGVAGPALLLAFFLNGLVTAITAMAYAELGSAFHDAGGGYLWVKTGLPDPNGFLSGWISWFAHAVACSLYALGFGAYFHEVLTALNIRIPFPGGHADKALAVLVILFFGYINYRGASETGKAGLFVTLAKVVVIAFFIGIGIIATFKNPLWINNFLDFFPKGFGGVVTAMGLTFIAFQGYEIIAQCSEEVVNPKRNIPRAISHPSTYPSILRAAAPIARKQQGEVICLTVAEVPDGEPLLKGMDRAPALEPLLEEAVAFGALQGLRIRPILKFAHRISYGVVDTVREEDCNFILVGRGRNLNFIERVFASVVDIVTRDAPVEVGVVVGDIPAKVETILLPFTEEAHAHLARRLLPAYCEYYGARVKVARVVDADSPAVLEKAAAGLRAAFEGSPFPVVTEVVPAADVVSGLVKAARNCQLIIMGGTVVSLLEGLIAPPIPYQLADRTRIPMLIVRKFGEETDA